MGSIESGQLSEEAYVEGVRKQMQADLVLEKVLI